MLSNLLQISRVPDKLWIGEVPVGEHSNLRASLGRNDVFTSRGNTVYVLGGADNRAGFIEHNFSDIAVDERLDVIKSIMRRLLLAQGFRPYQGGSFYCPQDAALRNGLTVRHTGGAYLNPAFKSVVNYREGAWELAVLPRTVITRDGQLYDSDFSRANSTLTSDDNKYSAQKASFERLMLTLQDKLYRDFGRQGVFEVKVNDRVDLGVEFIQDASFAFHRDNDLTASYPLAGLKRHHPFSYNMGDAPESIRVAYIGTGLSVNEILDNLNTGVGAFMGFQEVYKSALTMGSTRVESLSRDELASCSSLLAVKTLYLQKLQRLQEKDQFDILIVELPDQLSHLFRSAEGNLRHHLKIEFLKRGIPTQFINPTKFLANSDANKYYDLGLGLYVGAGYIPWKIQSSEEGECFVGVSFGVAKSGTILVGIAEVFDAFGESIAMRSTEQRFEPRGKGYHLSGEGTAEMIGKLLEDYKEFQGNYPSSLTVHKTSFFDQEEIDGLESLRSRVSSLATVHIQDHPAIRLYDGHQEPLRGSFIRLERDQALIYTDGYLNSARRYIGMFGPVPLQLNIGGDMRSTDHAARQIMRLSMLNWNSTRSYERLPVTLSHSRKVVDLLREGLEPSGIVRDFRYYI